MMVKHVEYRDFPVNPEVTKFVKIPVNGHGEPIRTSREWKTKDGPYPDWLISGGESGG
jgi:hypothetical protein